MIQKLLLLFALLFVHQSFASYAPVSIKGQGDASAEVLTNLQLPHKQATKTGNRTWLLESGNPNKLINPGLEHFSSDTGWSVSQTGTASVLFTGVSPSVFKDGSKSGSIICSGGASGGTCLVYQDVPSVEVQGLVKAMVKANAAGAKLYTRVNGVNTLSKDVAINIPNTVRIPQTMGSTSTGIAIEVTVAASQSITVDFDEAFVGAQSLLTEVPTCNGSAECETEFRASVTNTGAVTDAEFGYVSSCTSSAPYTCTFKTGFFSVAPKCVISGTTGNNTTLAASNATTSQVLIGSITDSGTSAASGFTLSCKKQGVDYAKAKATSPGYLSSATDANKISEIIFTSGTSAPTGFISAMNKSIGKTTGDYIGSEYYALYAILWAQPGITTTAGDVYRISSAKGGSAQADWDAGKTITVDYLTNSPFIRAAGTGLTRGQYRDSENKAHFHTPGLNSQAGAITRYGTTTLSTASTWLDNDTSGGAPSGTVTANTSTVGGTEAHPKEVALNAWIRYSADNWITGSFKENKAIAARFYSTSGQTLTTSTTVSIIYNNVQYNNGFSYNSSNGQVEVLTDGFYSINVLGTMNITGSVGANSSWFASVQITRAGGGVEFVGHDRHIFYAVPFVASTVTVPVQINLQAGDKVSIVYQQLTGSNRSLTTGPDHNVLTIARVGAGTM